MRRYVEVARMGRCLGTVPEAEAGDWTDEAAMKRLICRFVSGYAAECVERGRKVEAWRDADGWAANFKPVNERGIGLRVYRLRAFTADR